MQQKTYHFPCQHETEDIPISQQVPDHHPLTEQEIVELLKVAVTVDHHTANSIQIRLGQGVIGLVCPHEIEGQVARNGAEIDSLYVGYITNPQTYEDVTLLAKRLYDLMQVKEETT